MLNMLTKAREVTWKWQREARQGTKMRWPRRNVCSVILIKAAEERQWVLSDTVGAVQALLGVWFGQKLCRLAARRLILCCPEVVGATHGRKKKKATLVFHHVEYYIERQRRTVLSTVTASWQQAQSCHTILSSLNCNSQSWGPFFLTRSSRKITFNMQK